MAGSPRVAVVGSGVAGLTAAWIASRTGEVTLFEADDRLGGHADTHRVDTPDGPLDIDTGFIVHNERTYPTLLRLFGELGVTTQPSEMSLSVSSDDPRDRGLEYAGARGLRGLFPTPRALARPGYLRMLTDIPRFHRRARRLLAAGSDDARSSAAGGQTLREFLAAGGFSASFIRHFAEPLVAAVWSCDTGTALDYPARYLFTFLDHHGMLSVFGSPRWRTVTGGSREYVSRVAAGVGDVRTGTKVTSVVEGTGAADEDAAGVVVTDGSGRSETYDAVVIATHPDQALAMLPEATRTQQEVLGAMPYSHNTAQLHTDTSLLARAEGARASWNFLRRADPATQAQGGGAVTVTYDLTRLMRLPTDTRYLVSLGAADLVDPAQVIATREYAHPRYTPASVAAQQRLGECDTDRVVFAGAYHGWGFHEDGARSGRDAVAKLGLNWPAPQGVAAPQARTPAIYRTEITHRRRAPFARTFTHRSHLWLADLDHLPDHGVLARFCARDHLGSPDRSIRANVEAFLASRGIDLGGGRILLAAHPRAFGYCFNPISVFWCHDADGSLAATVVEVHNTYGDRHAYLVHPDEQGRARADKQMYVSPFHGTDGYYELAVPVPGERLDLTVTLHAHPGQTWQTPPAAVTSAESAPVTTPDPADSAPVAAFTAILRGVRTEVPVWRTAPAALLTSLLIRMHGVWLWLPGKRRRLRVQPRPQHHQDGVS